VRRILFSAIICCFMFPCPAFAGHDPQVKAAFLRDGDLWVLVHNQEKQITHIGKVFGKPKWSQDGTWLVYQKEGLLEPHTGGHQTELWVYEIETGEKKKIASDGDSPAWSPVKNQLAYTFKNELRISDLKKVTEIAVGVEQFAWLPYGNGFILSSAGVLRPDGWGGAILYTKKVKEPYKDFVLFGGSDPFFSLPKEIGLNGNRIIAVNAGHIHFSPSKKWISFIVSPTASWSMDSNMVCVIDKDGNHFQVLDEVVFAVGKPKWAPSRDTFAFIAGGGRIVFGFKNKDLKVREMPASGTYTPKNFADLDFDWVSDNLIIASRVPEREWSNDFHKHPLPVLYSIQINTNKQVKITQPPKGYGDYNLQYTRSMGKLVWFRGKSITDEHRSVWKANLDGSGAKEWIKNADEISIY
jgi:hypothetical protein